MSPNSWGPPDAVRVWIQSKVGQAFVRDVELEQANILTQLLTVAKNSPDIAEVRGKRAHYEALTQLLGVLQQARSITDGDQRG